MATSARTSTALLLNNLNAIHLSAAQAWHAQWDGNTILCVFEVGIQSGCVPQPVSIVMPDSIS